MDQLETTSPKCPSIVAEAEERQERQLSGASALNKVEDTIRTVCKEEGVKATEVKGGSRRRQISRIRKTIALELIESYGIPMATIARATGVTTTAISKMMAR